MKTVYIQFESKPPYCRDSFITGFKRLGYDIVVREPIKPLEQDEIAVVWNKMPRSRESILNARKGSGALIVVENGYYGRDKSGIQSYALALDGHNGSGRWFCGDKSRLEALGIDFKPLKEPGEEILIADQRGMGAPNMRSPIRFTSDTRAALRGFTKRPIRVRQHPRRAAKPVPLLTDLNGIHTLVVWASNAATQALIEGYPVFYCAPYIVTAGASQLFDPRRIENRTLGDREAAFTRMAWAQAFMSEIKSGEALSRLIEVHNGTLPSCQKGAGI